MENHRTGTDTHQAAPYLKITHLSKMFGDFSALQDISLAVQDGEFVCFLGPSGCGKTTLLRAIAGLDIQTTGTIEQSSRDVSALPPSERDFGIVFQSYALFPNLTVAKNIAYGLENRKMARAAVAERVRELVELVGLEGQETKYPAQLSGGQQQRVALARALAPSPGLLLLDEPLSALDAKVRTHLRHEVKDLQRQLGVTTIMVTHDQEEALTMADRIVVMNHGVIEQVGSPEQIYREPASAFVADFVGTMNFLTGEIVAEDRVRVGSVVLDCPPQAGAVAGQAVTVAVRPEDVTVRLNGSGSNQIDMQIESMEFLGSFFRAALSHDDLGGDGITADLSVNAVHDLAIGASRALRIALPADRLRVFSG